MCSDTFLTILIKVTQEFGFDTAAMPAMLLRKWEQFIESCEDGYSWDVSEYNNEIRVRDQIESILGSDKLQRFEELSEFRHSVEALDKRLRTLFQTRVSLADRAGWWNQGVLKEAGYYYADYMKAAHGIHVERVE
jgi:hypothetical protein